MEFQRSPTTFIFYMQKITCFFRKKTVKGANKYKGTMLSITEANHVAT